MAIDPTTRESRLLYAYANALRTADGEDMVEPAEDGDMSGVQETAEALGDATSQGFQIVGNDDGSLSHITDPAINAQYSAWHGVLAGQAAQRIEDIGFDVHKVEVGSGSDTLHANFGDIPVTIAMGGGGENVFGELTTLYGLINDNVYDENATAEGNASLMGGVAAVHFSSGNGYVSFEMTDGTEVLLDKSQLTATAFQGANKTAVALSQDSPGFTGRVSVEEKGEVTAEYVYNDPSTGEAVDFVTLGDVSGLDPQQLRASFMDKAALLIGERVGAAAEPNYYTAVMLNPDLSLLERLNACRKLATVWPKAVAGEVPEEEVFQAVLTALNQPGEVKDSEGFQLNMAGIEVLGEIPSRRSVEILALIVRGGQHEEFRTAARTALENLAQNASDEKVKARAAAVLRRGSGASNV